MSPKFQREYRNVFINIIVLKYEDRVAKILREYKWYKISTFYNIMRNNNFAVHSIMAFHPSNKNTFWNVFLLSASQTTLGVTKLALEFMRIIISVLIIKGFQIVKSESACEIFVFCMRTEYIIFKPILYEP